MSTFTDVNSPAFYLACPSRSSFVDLTVCLACLSPSSFVDLTVVCLACLSSASSFVVDLTVVCLFFAVKEVTLM